MIAILSLIVAGVAALVTLFMYLSDSSRQQVTPSWQPARTKDKGEVSEEYAKVRDRGSIYAVGEGAMQDATLDVQHGSLVCDEGYFPRIFTARDEPIQYRFIAKRDAVAAGKEPIVALYWYQSGPFGRRLKGTRLHTQSLRYEQLTKSRVLPWKHRWQEAAKPPTKLPALTCAPSLKWRIW